MSHRSHATERLTDAAACTSRARCCNARRYALLDVRTCPCAPPSAVASIHLAASMSRALSTERRASAARSRTRRACASSRSASGATSVLLGSAAGAGTGGGAVEGGLANTGGLTTGSSVGRFTGSAAKCGLLATAAF
eukprot:5318757-Pleurochrysis_carterae.AAC.1